MLVVVAFLTSFHLDSSRYRGCDVPGFPPRSMIPASGNKHQVCQTAYRRTALAILGTEVRVNHYLRTIKTADDPRIITRCCFPKIRSWSATPPVVSLPRHSHRMPPNGITTARFQPGIGRTTGQPSIAVLREFDRRSDQGRFDGCPRFHSCHHRTAPFAAPAARPSPFGLNATDVMLVEYRK